MPLDVRYSVTLTMYMQPGCPGSGIKRDSARTLAELVFDGGGFVWFSVDRRDDGRLEVAESYTSDGLCMTPEGKETSCPVDRNVLATIDAPVGVTTTERFYEVTRDDPDEHGRPGKIRETELLCGPK